MKELRKQISQHWYKGEWLDIMELSLNKMQNEPQYNSIKQICDLKWKNHKSDAYIAVTIYLSERQIRKLVCEFLMVGLAYAVTLKRIVL